MKHKNYLFPLFAIAIFMCAGCEKDNRLQPESTLTGRVVYQGQPLGLRSAGVQFELWQYGYQLFTKIPLNIKQDGTFSATLFDGDYKLVRLKGAGPWVDMSDSIDVKIKGTTAVDVPVEPFFIIKNESFEKTGTTVKGTFILQRVNTTRTLELARIYIGPNLIVDQNNNSANTQILAAAITDLSQPVTLNVTIPASIVNDNFIFVRIGVKTIGVAELLYTIPQKIQLK